MRSVRSGSVRVQRARGAGVPRRARCRAARRQVIMAWGEGWGCVAAVRCGWQWGGRVVVWQVERRRQVVVAP